MKRFARTDSARSLRFCHVVVKRTMVVVRAAIASLQDLLPTGPMIGSPRVMAARPNMQPALSMAPARIRVARPQEGSQR